jgi:hypothetical protein
MGRIFALSVLVATTPLALLAVRMRKDPVFAAEVQQEVESRFGPMPALFAAFQPQDNGKTELDNAQPIVIHHSAGEPVRNKEMIADASAAADVDLGVTEPIIEPAVVSSSLNSKEEDVHSVQNAVSAEDQDVQTLEVPSLHLLQAEMEESSRKDASAAAKKEEDARYVEPGEQFSQPQPQFDASAFVEEVPVTVTATSEPLFSVAAPEKVTVEVSAPLSTTTTVTTDAPLLPASSSTSSSSAPVSSTATTVPSSVTEPSVAAVESQPAAPVEPTVVYVERQESHEERAKSIRLTPEEYDARLSERVLAAVADASAALTAEAEERLRHQEEELRNKYQARLFAIERSLTEKYNEERSTRLSELGQLKGRASEALAVVASLSAHRSHAAGYHMLGQSLASLTHAIESAGSFDRELAIAKRAAAQAGREVADVVSVLDAYGAQGVRSLGQLSARFETVFREARRACFIPHHSGVFGFLFGTMVAKVTRPLAEVDAADTSAEARLVRARKMLQDGNLDAAVAEVRQIGGLPGKLAREWLAEASARLTAEHVLSFLRAEMVVHSASFDESF